MESNATEKTEPTVELLQKILETEKKQLRCGRFRLWLGIIGVLLAVLSLVLLLTGMFWMKGQIETLSAAVRETAEKINELLWNKQQSESTVVLYISYLRKRIASVGSGVRITAKRNIGYTLTF